MNMKPRNVKVSGLPRDEPRPGKPAKYGIELRDRILAQLELAPPQGVASWDDGSLATALWVSDVPVWRVLRKQGIQLQRHRSWCVSTDPEFAAKADDVIGLYLNPPDNALVLSVDEKPSIQALERARGYMQTSSGKIVQGTTSTYKRHAPSTCLPRWRSPLPSSAARQRRQRSARTSRPSSMR